MQSCAFSLLVSLLICPSFFAVANDSLFSIENQTSDKQVTQAFGLNATVRFQLRHSTPFDGQPTKFQDYLNDSGHENEINRARLTIKGWLGQPWIKVSMDYDLANFYVLDYRLMLEKYDEFKIKAGQWKFEYSREQSVSSGGQQMMDRSIINRQFTLDRQLGISVYGHIDHGSAVNFNYWLGIGTGTGRGNEFDGDSHPLYFGRLQWNVLGKEMKFVASDISYSEQPVASVAVAGAKNRSQFTRFSSSGGGNLTGFQSSGIAGQYDVKQFTLDGVVMYRGFSGQAEYHEKEVTDRLDDTRMDMRGFYIQWGYILPTLSRNVELAMRYAEFKPDFISQEAHVERSFAINWFLSGHKNKLTFETTQFEYSDLNFLHADLWRHRLQWDVTF